MNELMIVYNGGQWLYYKTSQQTARSALNEFEALCGRTGINTDNMRVQSAVLRDPLQNDIGFFFSDKNT